MRLVIEDMWYAVILNKATAKKLPNALQEPTGPFHTFWTGRKDFFGLLRESAALFWMIDICWLLVSGKQKDIAIY